jgi:hypothetical protein
LIVKDAHEMDKKIPRDLIITYQGKPYATKAALEWKAMHLYGGGAFGITTEVVDRQKDYVLAKAMFKTLSGIEYSNYGEASTANVSNPMMLKHLLHLAVTRAECRVLRMATACAYASIEEMDTGGEKALPVSENDSKEPTAQQVAVLRGMKIDAVPKTQKEAKELIANAIKEDHGKTNT